MNKTVSDEVIEGVEGLQEGKNSMGDMMKNSKAFLDFMKKAKPAIEKIDSKQQMAMASRTTKIMGMVNSDDSDKSKEGMKLMKELGKELKVKI